MNFERYLKSVLSGGFWPFIRKGMIIRKHHKVVNQIAYLVNSCNAEKLGKLHLTKKANIPQDRIVIWQYWAQGYEKDKVPSLISMCLESVDKHATTDYTIIRLSDANVSLYIDIPDWLVERKRQISIAHYADILRCMLLLVYGGLWLDAAVFLTGNLPQYLFEHDFFMFQRNPSEPNKDYWEHTFAYYFGWDKKFRVNVLNGIMYAKVGNKVVSDMCKMLLEYWKKHDKIPDYFFFQILFDIYIKSNPQWNCPIVSDCPPHLLRQLINEMPLIDDINHIKEIISIHSLNYKNPNAAKRLKVLIANS